MYGMTFNKHEDISLYDLIHSLFAFIKRDETILKKERGYGKTRKRLPGKTH